MSFKIISKFGYILIVLIILRIAQIRTVNADPKGTKIIGGVEAKPGDAKYMVAILYTDKKDNVEYFTCGGSLISKTKILTAAHCFFDENDIAIDPLVMFVSMGSIYRYGDSNALTFDIDKYVYHANYVHRTKKNDVGLIMIKGIELKKNPKLELITLTDRKEKVDENCTIYGWGLTNRFDPNSYPRKLRKLNLNILDFDKCRSSYSIFRSEFCAGFWPGEKDACTGDSGGPLVCDGKQLGIVSRGYNCALPDYPTVYESVYYYKSWIENDYKTLGKFGNSEIVKVNYFLIIYLIFLWILI